MLVGCAGRQPATLDELRAPEWRLAQVHLNNVSATMIRWEMAGGAGCPSMSELRSLAPGLPQDDPWGRRILTRCDERGFVAVSMGPDGRLGTRDDASSTPVVSHQMPNRIGNTSGDTLNAESYILQGNRGF